MFDKMIFNGAFRLRCSIIHIDLQATTVTVTTLGEMTFLERGQKILLSRQFRRCVMSKNTSVTEITNW